MNTTDHRREKYTDHKENSQEEYRENVLKLFEGMCFRRIYRVNADLLSRPARFHGFTVSYTLRGESDIFKGESLYFSSYTEYDLNEKGELVMLSQYRRGIAPKKDQLLCGVVATEPDKKCRPYLKWFKCSEQFYKTITAIRRNDSKISIDRLIDSCKDTHNESYSYISYFYQNLLHDCIGAFSKEGSDMYTGNQLSCKGYTGDQHNIELYLLFKNKVTKEKKRNEEEDCDFPFQVLKR